MIDNCKLDTYKFAARYLFKANRIDFAPPDDPHNILYNFLCDSLNKKDAINIIKNTGSINLFLELISKQNNLNLMDKKVIEAYWIGNELLDNIEYNQIKDLIIKDFVKNGMKKDFAKEISKKIPKDALPTHSFHIMHINNITKNPFVKTDPHKCLIRSSIVKEIKTNENIIIPNSSFKNKIKYNSDLTPNLKKGDIVAIHWDMAIDKLSKKQAENLNKYNKINIEAFKSNK